MSTIFWIRRFLIVLAITFAIIFGVQLLKGHTLEDSLAHAGSWAVMATSIFIGARYYQSSKGQHCALCRDTPVG
ncbi:MAG: hypothetical protein ACREO1_01365 [Arenimonas sp.]